MGNGRREEKGGEREDEEKEVKRLRFIIRCKNGGGKIAMAKVKKMGETRRQVDGR